MSCQDSAYKVAGGIQATGHRAQTRESDLRVLRLAFCEGRGESVVRAIELAAQEPLVADEGESLGRLEVRVEGHRGGFRVNGPGGGHVEIGAARLGSG
jgi:hypothetical protein